MRILNELIERYRHYKGEAEKLDYRIQTYIKTRINESRSHILADKQNEEYKKLVEELEKKRNIYDYYANKINSFLKIYRQYKNGQIDEQTFQFELSQIKTLFPDLDFSELEQSETPPQVPDIDLGNFFEEVTQEE